MLHRKRHWASRSCCVPLKRTAGSPGAKLEDAPPNPVHKHFYPRGTVSTLTPHHPPLPHRPPKPPPVAPPPPPPVVLRYLHRISVKAAPATLARRGQSHAPDPGANSPPPIPHCAPFRAWVEDAQLHTSQAQLQHQGPGHENS